MNFIGGTVQARSLFSQLLKKGKLFLPYAKENFTTFFSGENDESWLDFISNNGRQAENHLAVIYLDQYDTETFEALLKVYPPLHEAFKVNTHKPDFLVLNLNSKRILAIGLGRKNRFFAFDVLSNQEVWCWNFGIEDGDKEYIFDFTSLDLKEVVYELASDLCNLGITAYDDYLGNDSTSSSVESGTIFERMFPSLVPLDLDTGDY